MEKNKKDEEFPSVAVCFEEIEYEALPEEQKEHQNEEGQSPQGPPY